MSRFAAIEFGSPLLVARCAEGETEASDLQCLCPPGPTRTIIFATVAKLQQEPPHFGCYE